MILAVECPNCGIENQAQATRCAACFTSLGPAAAKPLYPPAPLLTSKSVTTPTPVAAPKAHELPPSSPPEASFNWASKTPLTKTMYVLASLIGYAVGRYAQIHGLLPAFTIGMMFLITRKTLKGNLQPYAILFSVIAGHTLSITTGGLLMHQVAMILPDVILFGAGLVWLFLRPGMSVLVYFGVLEIVIGALNVNNLLQSPYGSLPHRALTAHIAIRLWALTQIGILIYKNRKLEQRA